MKFNEKKSSTMLVTKELTKSSFRMYQLNKISKKINAKNENFLFKFKDQKIKSQDILQIFILLILLIILYYVNWLKWSSSDSLNTYERFISLDKPTELKIINFNKDDDQSYTSSDSTPFSSFREAYQNQKIVKKQFSDRSSEKSFDDHSSNENSLDEQSSFGKLFQESQLSLPDQENAFSESNHSFQFTNLNNKLNLSPTNSSFNFSFHNQDSSQNDSQDSSQLNWDSFDGSFTQFNDRSYDDPFIESYEESNTESSMDSNTQSFSNNESFKKNNPKSINNLNSEIKTHSNKKQIIKPTKVSSLQSFYKITNYKSNSDKNLVDNLMKNELANDEIKFEALEDGEKEKNEIKNKETSSKERQEIDVNEMNDLDQQEQKLKESVESSMHSIQVLSSKHKVELKIDNRMVFQSSNSPANRGFHIFVLNQHNLKLMSHRVFDTYSSSFESNQLKNYLQNKVSKNRLLVFAIQDEASYALNNETIEFMQSIGCKLCMDLGWRDMYVMVTINSFDSKLLISEQINKNDHAKSWGEPLELDLKLDLDILSLFMSCRLPYDYLDEPSYARKRREKFCTEVEGYADSICNCDGDPTQIVFDTIPIPDNRLTNVPVAVIAANRPYYLHSMLNSLLTANGVNISMITIYIDGMFKEPYELAKLFGLRIVQHKPIGRANARISQHYYFSLNEMFNHHSTSDFAIIFEEDLILSPDVFHYFSQTKHLLEEDPSIYCISAWNDNSYVHSSSDEKLCYRVETMPGLGWMLTRKLWIDELKPKWPSRRLNYDWDLWVRDSRVREGRECIIPDVSRTYHLGVKGVNMNRAFHERYFENRALNQISFVNLTNVDRLIELNYELHILDLIKNGQVINEKLDIIDEENELINNLEDSNPNLKNLSRKKIIKLNKRTRKNKDRNEKSFCNQLLNYFKKLNSTTHSSDLLKERSIDLSDQPAHILYISMKHEQDFDNWLKCASCLHLWDLVGDPRGMHKGMWRFFLNDHHVLVIGSPSSPYSVFKESHIQPILINS